MHSFGTGLQTDACRCATNANNNNSNIVNMKRQDILPAVTGDFNILSPPQLLKKEIFHATKTVSKEQKF